MATTSNYGIGFESNEIPMFGTPLTESEAAELKARRTSSGKVAVMNIVPAPTFVQSERLGLQVAMAARTAVDEVVAHEN